MSIARADTADKSPMATTAVRLNPDLLFRTLFPRLVVMPGLWDPSITVRLHRQPIVVGVPLSGVFPLKD
jgi:hypothetical protein